MTRDWDDLADELGVKAVRDGEPTRWYDELWSASGAGEVALPWDRTNPHPVLADWVAERVAAHGDGGGRRAVVVGCGLGADSEHLARHGWRTTAFDISPAAVAAVRDRYPDSPVDYRRGRPARPHRRLGRPGGRVRPGGGDLHAAGTAPLAARPRGRRRPRPPWRREPRRSSSRSCAATTRPSTRSHPGR